MRATRVVTAALVAGASLTVVAQPAWAQDDEEPGSAAQLQFAAKRRDPTTAFAMSLVLGFGAGHFYSSQWLLGAVFAGSQAVGGVLAGVGAGLGGLDYYVDETSGLPVDRSGEGSAGTALFVGGIVLLGLSRVVDMAWAPISAHSRNEELLIELGITPMVGENGQVGLAAGGRF